MNTEKSIQRFWSMVAKQSEGDCWLWQGSVSPNGYGKFYCLNNSHAHRFAASLNSPAPTAKSVAMHSCNNKLCCNPAHLSWGTQKQNISYARDCGAIKSAKLNTGKVAEIKQLAHQGYPKLDIARAYGVSRWTISNIVNGHTWGGAAM